MSKYEQENRLVYRWNRWAYFSMIALYDYLISKNYDVSFVTDQRGEKYFTDDVKHKIKIFNIKKFNDQKGLFKNLPKTFNFAS